MIFLTFVVYFPSARADQYKRRAGWHPVGTLVCHEPQSRMWNGAHGSSTIFNISRPGQNERQLADDIFKLTHWGRVTHICVSKLTINGSDNGLSPGRQCWNIVNGAFRNKLQWNFNRKAYIFISRKCSRKCRLWNIGRSVWASMCWFSSMKTVVISCFTKICSHGLTYWGRVTHICVGNVGHHWYR